MTSRLIVSFVGDRDLQALGLRTARASEAPPVESDQSPILRLVNHLSAQGLCAPAHTRLMLFDDDGPGQDTRQRFCHQLPQVLREIGLGGLPVERCPIKLQGGPTDLNGLYHGVWSAIPKGSRQPDEIVFHLSSGTPAMQVTLLLAAHCLPIKNVRLYETSREQGTVEVTPPYVLAAREIQRFRSRSRPNLGKKATDTLLPGTVIDDAVVAGAYAALHKAATRRSQSGFAPTLVIGGPSGSGKWHAARQFGHWRGGDVVQWLEPAPIWTEASTTPSTVLVRRLDSWPPEALARLSAWRLSWPQVAVAATWRTDVSAAAPLSVVARDGLQGAEHVLLPALSARSDIVALGKAIASLAGIWDGKLQERLQYELLTDIFPHNLHDLQSVLVTAANLSKGPHPERAAYIEARQVADAAEARSLLGEAFKTLVGLHFGVGRPTLDEVLDLVRAMVVRCAQAEGRTQADVAELLQCSQSTVSKVIQQPIDLRHWRTRLAARDADPQ